MWLSYSIKEPKEQYFKRRAHGGCFLICKIISRRYQKSDSDDRGSSISSSCFYLIGCPLFGNPPHPWKSPSYAPGNLVLEKSLGVKFKDDLFAQLCLKLWFESDWYFCNITTSGWFWKRLSRNKVPNCRFLKSVWKSNCPEFHCRTLNSYFGSNVARKLMIRCIVKQILS